MYCLTKLRICKVINTYRHWLLVLAFHRSRRFKKSWLHVTIIPADLRQTTQSSVWLTFSFFAPFGMQLKCQRKVHRGATFLWWSEWDLAEGLVRGLPWSQLLSCLLVCVGLLNSHQIFMATSETTQACAQFNGETVHCCHPGVSGSRFNPLSFHR